MTSKWEEWKKNVGDSRPWHLLNSENNTSEEISEKRLQICKLCPELIQITNQCKKCGCVMPLKVKLKTAECPIGKWERVDE